MTTSTSVQAYTDRRDFTHARIPPLWEGRRGQIANLWLYAYCGLLSPFILPLLYPAWEEVDFDTVQTVRVEGFRLHKLVHRGNVLIERKGQLNPVRIEGIKNPEDLKTLIDGALERWRRRQAPAPRT